MKINKDKIMFCFKCMKDTLHFRKTKYILKCYECGCKRPDKI